MRPLASSSMRQLFPEPTHHPHTTPSTSQEPGAEINLAHITHVQVTHITNSMPTSAGPLKWCVDVDASDIVGSASGHSATGRRARGASRKARTTKAAEEEGNSGDSGPATACTTWADLNRVREEGGMRLLAWPLAGVALHAPGIGMAAREYVSAVSSMFQELN